MYLITPTRNSDYLILFIKTDDAHKVRMLSHTTFNTFKKCNRGEGMETLSKMMVVAIWWLFLQLQK